MQALFANTTFQNHLSLMNLVQQVWFVQLKGLKGLWGHLNIPSFSKHWIARKFNCLRSRSKMLDEKLLNFCSDQKEPDNFVLEIAPRAPPWRNNLLSQINAKIWAKIARTNTKWNTHELCHCFIISSLTENSSFSKINFWFPSFQMSTISWKPLV